MLHSLALAKEMRMAFISTLWWLILGHFVADYPLQSDFIGKYKNPLQPIDVSRVPPGQKPNIIWPWVLTAHAATHAALVGFITGSVTISLLEFIAHWLIDLAKCLNWTNIHIDQVLHIMCKIIWTVLFVFLRSRML